MTDRAQTYRDNNREKLAEKARRWREDNPEAYARVIFRRCAKSIGLDPDEVERKFSEHNGLCDCCGNPPEASKARLSIDHDHNRPGVFRGFICTNCNIMLGHAKDDPDRLLAGVAYLRR